MSDQKNNEIMFYDVEVASRVPFMIRSLVYIWTVLATIGMLLISRRPVEEDARLKNSTFSDVSATEVSSSQTSDRDINISNN